MKQFLKESTTNRQGWAVWPVVAGFAFAGLAPVAWADLITLELKDSNGADITGDASFSYRIGFSGSYTPIPTNSTNSVDLPAGDRYNIKVKHLVSENIRYPVDNTGGTTVTFNTTKVTLALETCGGDTVPDDGFSYRVGFSGAYQPITGAAIELLPLTRYNFKVDLGIADNKKYPVDNASDTQVTFQTTTPNLTGSLEYRKGFSGSWNAYSAPLEMLPSAQLVSPPQNYRFRSAGDGSGGTVVDVAGCNLSGGQLTLLDNAGDGLPGGMAQAACGGSWKSTQGPTDANGKLFYTESCGISKIKMTYNQGSEQQTNAQMAASDATWQTEQAIVKLTDNTGTGLAGGRVDQGGGFWDLHGYTDGIGELALELFKDKSYKIKMSINGTSEWHWFPVPGTIDFQTGRVTSTTCSHYAAGSWRAIPSGGIELLPKTNYKFKSPTTYAAVLAGVVNTIECVEAAEKELALQEAPEKEVALKEAATKEAAEKEKVALQEVTVKELAVVKEVTVKESAEE